VKYELSGKVSKMETRGSHTMMELDFADINERIPLFYLPPAQLQAERVSIGDSVRVGWEPGSPIETAVRPAIDFVTERKLSWLRTICLVQFAIIMLILMFLPALSRFF